MLLRDINTRKNNKAIKRMVAFLMAVIIVVFNDLTMFAADGDREVTVKNSYSKFIKADEIKKDGKTQYMIAYKNGDKYYALTYAGEATVDTTDITSFVMSDGSLRVVNKDLYSWVYETHPGNGTNDTDAQYYGYLKPVSNASTVFRIATNLIVEAANNSYWSQQIKFVKSESDDTFTINNRNSSGKRCVGFDADNEKFVPSTTSANVYIYEMVSEEQSVIEPSASIRENYSVGGDLYRAYSDTGTSDIEEHISTVTGQVMVDKSVAYKTDVYDSEYTYGNGDFSVILSALSDQYIKEINEEKSFIDPLEEGSSLIFTDIIGAGMEIKEAPIVRYNGINYRATVSTEGYTTKYKYEGDVSVSGNLNTNDVVSLSGIVLTITKKDDGTSTIEWEIPENLIPLLMRESETEILYDIKPIRLILHVGPSGEGATCLESGTTLYTNKWDYGSETYVTFKPSEDNGYYSTDYKLSSNKTDVVTNTAVTYLNGVMTEEGTVKVMLGNNGKLMNLSKFSMPLTGGSGTSIYYMIGLTMICSSLGLLYKKNYQRRKQNEH